MKNPPKNTARPIGILIADDEEINYYLLETLLKDVFQLDTNIYHAINGEEAINIYSTKAKLIDLIFMDIRMPVTDGFSATKQIRDLQSKVPIIAQTAYASNENRDKALISGCNELIPKPISKKLFGKIINKYLNLGVDNF
ncbi:MAG: response regulator [Bacteroidota bacterium]|nr:response regulator [Bacteroidota bacterium]